MATIEEKAKRYDEAIKRANELNYVSDKDSLQRKTVEHIFPELKESDDERMIQYFKDLAPFDKADELYEKYGFSHKDAIAWLEKQDEHAKFRDSIQVGDKVTRNEDGVLVNLSQLKRVARKDEKQGEQKPAAWSEEDEKMFEHIIAKATLHFSSINYLDEEEINFLKSLKDRFTWKPSDEQMYSLNWVANVLLKQDGIVEKETSKILDSLYNDLKRLLKI